MINVSDLKRGVLLDLEGAPWQVIDCAFQSPSARGASTLAKIRIKNLKSGQVLNRIRSNPCVRSVIRVTPALTGSA